MIEKVCAWCGGPVSPTSDNTQNQKYCSIECREAAKNEKKQQTDMENRIRERAKIRAAQAHVLDECVKEAKKLGISYGKYMAQRSERGKRTNILPTISPCPVCGTIPTLGYACGEYFMTGDETIECPACGTTAFVEMHSDPVQEIEAWNRWCDTYAKDR